MTTIDPAEVARIAKGLSKAQREMVGYSFYVDGWHNRHFWKDAIGLREMGLATETERLGDQYTAYDYEPTEAGLAVQAILREQGAHD